MQGGHILRQRTLGHEWNRPRGSRFRGAWWSIFRDPIRCTMRWRATSISQTKVCKARMGSGRWGDWCRGGAPSMVSSARPLLLAPRPFHGNVERAAGQGQRVRCETRRTRGLHSQARAPTDRPRPRFPIKAPAVAHKFSAVNPFPSLLHYGVIGSRARPSLVPGGSGYRY